MTTKNLGPLSSVYLDPEGRGFETVVFQANKPVVDGELVLSGDLIDDARRAAMRLTSPSGWVSKHFLKDKHVESLFTASVVANRLTLSSPLDAVVNGWALRVSDTGALGSNYLDLGATAPAPAKTTNLVVLEVWRKLLGPSPSTDGKSISGKIFRFGNVKYADDPTNFPDDILNPMVGAETTKRVQIQYRLRVISSSVDLVQYPDGISDPSVVAHSVPAAPIAPDGVATLFPYSPSLDDPGLWIAGDGNPANTLGTVDGYMYAIPLVAVFRRNSTAWDRNSNQNGGVASPGPSDRPDGLFYDIITSRDVADLRRSVSLTGFSPQELGDRGFRLLLDNEVRTEFGSTQFGPTPTGGMDGHTLVWCDQIGIPGAGDGIDTGNAVPAGALVRTFDGVCRRFSDRPLTEVVTVRLDPTDQVPPAANWVNGAVVAIDLSALKVAPSATPYSFSSYAPVNTHLVNVDNVRFTGDGSIPGSVSAVVPYSAITNLGLYPAVNTFIILGSLAGIPGLTNEPMYVDVTVQYPGGEGLQKTPSGDFGLSSLEINNPAAMPVSYSGTYQVGFDYAHREVEITYDTVTIGPISIRSKVTDAGYDRVRLPERAISLGTVTRNGAPLVGSATLSTDGREVLLDTDFITFPDTIEVSYVARRPFPENGPQVSVFYETRVYQSVKEADLPASLKILPRYISPRVSVLAAGPSSPYGEAYPFPYAYAQTGGLYNTSLSPAVDESDLDSNLDLEVQGMSVSSGFLELGALLPYSPTDFIDLQRTPGDDDAEGRTFYPSVVPGYLPNAFAPGLTTPKKHKSFFPVLAELLEDSGVGKKGQLVLVMFYRWCEDGGVSVSFNTNPTQNTSTAAVYRLPGNPLNKSV